MEGAQRETMQRQVKWRCPLDGYELRPTTDRNSFKEYTWWPVLETGLPMLPDGYGSDAQFGAELYHPGAFGVLRRHDIHMGVDLYCQPGTFVRAVEPGIVVAVGPFTGPNAGSPWWNDTDFIMVEGESGVVCYGEVTPFVIVGDELLENACIGTVTQVLKKDKGRPRCMLHLELYEYGTRNPVDWLHGRDRPVELRDPTPYLLGLAQ